MLVIMLPLAAYLIGSISSAVIVSRIMGFSDPRYSGSNNPGATNVLRVGGKKAALLTLVGDMLKGLLPVLLVKLLTDKQTIIALVGLAVFLGHLYPIFFKFKGGKGVATAGGVFIGFSLPFALMLILIWLMVAIFSKYASLSSLVTAVFAPILIYFFSYNHAYLYVAIIIALLLFLRHAENISRLLSANENKINFRK